MTDIIRHLLEWSSNNGINVHPALRIQVSDRHGVTPTSIAVFSDRHVPINEVAVSIPKLTILSVKTCCLAESIPTAPYGIGAQLALSIAVCGEFSKGIASRWHGYLQSLPRTTVPIAPLWGVDVAFGPDEDGRDARDWLAGTEVVRVLRGEEGQDPLNEIKQYYHTVARPLLPESCTMSHFLHAYSLVSSRAFMVDAYHGLSMVPIADAFNHVIENHVHLECDYDVCTICGSFAECSHDLEDVPASASESVDWHSSSVPSVPDTCDMVVNRPIAPSSEVFNTYGSQKSNASLLAWYGFALDGNENDIVGWDLAEVAAAFEDIETPYTISEELYKAVLRAWLSSLGSMLVDDSRLVYRPDMDAEAERTFVGPSTILRINGDAQVSVYLWVYVAVHAIVALSVDPCPKAAGPNGGGPTLEGAERLAVQLGVVMNQQVQLERLIASEEEGVGLIVERGGSQDSQVQLVLGRTSEMIASLCKHRLSCLGKHPDLSTAELGEMLDDIPDSKLKTRLAIAQVLAERSILESCQADWGELHETLSQHT